MCLCAVLMYPSPAQRRIIRVRSPMAPQDTPGRGARSSRHRRPPLASGGPEGVSKHPSLINGCGFADARRGLDMYPPLTRLRREYAPFRNDDRCVPAGLPKPELRRSIQNPVSIPLPTKMFEEPKYAGMARCLVVSGGRFLGGGLSCPMPLTSHGSSLFVNVAIPKACVIYNAGK